MDRAFLERWSREWVAAHDPARDRPMDETVRAGWLGFEPATEEQIAAAEARLGVRLPPSLRSFLSITDGWKNAGYFIYRLAGAAELEWLRDTDDGHWVDAYQDAIPGRSLLLSLAGDAAVLFLDPLDVGVDGEWAAYRVTSWSGLGLERFASFADLMMDLYASVHMLRQPPGETRDHWDAEVERARRAALQGEVDRPGEILAQAQHFGRNLAAVLRFQLCAMQGDWYTAPLSHLLLHGGLDLVHDPFFAAEVVPLYFVEDRLTYQTYSPTLEDLRLPRVAGPLREVWTAAREVVDGYEARRAAPGFRQPFGNPEFDRLVQAIVDDLPPPIDEPGSTGSRIVEITLLVGGEAGTFAGRPDQFTGEARRAAHDAAWPRLVAAMEAWRPVSDLHIAPVVLFTEPRLAELITPSRGRELLSLPRG